MHKLYLYYMSNAVQPLKRISYILPVVSRGKLKDTLTEKKKHDLGHCFSILQFV